MLEKPIVYNSGDLHGRRVKLTLVEDEFRKADGTVVRKLKPVFDREKNFGYESVSSDGAPHEEEMGSPPPECTCQHPFSAQRIGEGRCEAPDCDCKEFDELPF